MQDRSADIFGDRNPDSPLTEADLVKMIQVFQGGKQLMNSMSEKDNNEYSDMLPDKGIKECINVMLRNAAGEQKNIRLVKLILDARDVLGIDVNSKNSSGATALHCAIFFKNTEIVKLLIKAGADPNIPDNYGDTPLHVLKCMGKRNRTHELEELEQVIHDFVNPSSTSKKEEAEKELRIAASNNDIIKLIELIKDQRNNKININAQGKPSLKTALHWAVIKKHTHIAELLIVAGANAFIADNSGATVMKILEQNNNTDLIKIYSSHQNSHNNNNNNSASTVDTDQFQLHLNRLVIQMLQSPNRLGFHPTVFQQLLKRGIITDNDLTKVDPKSGKSILCYLKDAYPQYMAEISDMIYHQEARMLELSEPLKQFATNHADNSLIRYVQLFTLMYTEPLDASVKTSFTAAIVELFKPNYYHKQKIETLCNQLRTGFSLDKFNLEQRMRFQSLQTEEERSNFANTIFPAVAIDNLIYNCQFVLQMKDVSTKYELAVACTQLVLEYIKLKRELPGIIKSCKDAIAKVSATTSCTDEAQNKLTQIEESVLAFMNKIYHKLARIVKSSLDLETPFDTYFINFIEKYVPGNSIQALMFSAAKSERWYKEGQGEIWTFLALMGIENYYSDYRTEFQRLLEIQKKALQSRMALLGTADSEFNTLFEQARACYDSILKCNLTLIRQNPQFWLFTGSILCCSVPHNASIKIIDSLKESDAKLLNTLMKQYLLINQHAEGKMNENKNQSAEFEWHTAKLTEKQAAKRAEQQRREDNATKNHIIASEQQKSQFQQTLKEETDEKHQQLKQAIIRSYQLNLNKTSKQVFCNILEEKGTPIKEKQFIAMLNQFSPNIEYSRMQAHKIRIPALKNFVIENFHTSHDGIVDPAIISKLRSAMKIVGLDIPSLREDNNNNNTNF